MMRRLWSRGMFAAACMSLVLSPPTTLSAWGTQAQASSCEPVCLQALLEEEWTADDVRFIRRAAGMSTALDAAGAVDGDRSQDYAFHVAADEVDPWWQVDLQEVVALDRVVIYNRNDGGFEARVRHIRVQVSREDPADVGPEDFETVYTHDGSLFYGTREAGPLVVRFSESPVEARIVRLTVPGPCPMALAQVEVYGVGNPETNIALGKPADQKSVGPYSTMTCASRLLPEGLRFRLDHTERVLDRTEALRNRLERDIDPSLAAAFRDRLERLRETCERLAASPVPNAATRQDIHFQARRLLREIAFANPLLTSIDRLLFLKRHDPGGEFHMVDQYYGFNAIPGGGIYVLEGPFGDTPRIRDLLAHSIVSSGRLAGSRLAGGSFLSPDLTYDAKTLYFAYTQAKGTPGRPDLGMPKPEEAWTPETSFHLFRVNTDGTGLEQLTDGPENDFFPCVLPGGRIAFISERRGGFLRCGRHCPTYTLFSMEPDGSDIHPLSYHETHEWAPSVNNDGMIVYTRWDYVDRDTDIAHHKWICFPDGRDPRSSHGNYPYPRRDGRPWLEKHIRAIPGSHRYIAVAAAHHGHEFGSLILIDPHIPDDGAMSQVTRLTPEVPFPESEKMGREPMVYGTPWPLSEDDYLCVYDGEAKNRGVFWLDRFGNRELIYRDREISCISPMPLRPRPMPPVIPDQTVKTRAARAAHGGDRPATLGVINVYESDFTWPENTRITELRIIQVLPKTTPAPNDPRIGVGEQTNARAVLGTVPVEADGSAYFEAPVSRALYFQALDDTGMAVQSMRSATYVHPGERLTCVGCHEDKHKAPPPQRERPLAFRRPPSSIAPEPEGSNPFSYVRLVQPVLDRNCVQCHRQGETAPDLTGVLEENGFTRSYNNLARKYGFFYDVYNGVHVRQGSRSIPGRIGARAAKLTERINHPECGRTLSPEDRRRLIVWLDANSEFLGAYENAEAQRRGEVVYPSMN